MHRSLANPPAIASRFAYILMQEYITRTYIEDEFFNNQLCYMTSDERETQGMAVISTAMDSMEHSLVPRRILK